MRREDVSARPSRFGFDVDDLVLGNHLVLETPTRTLAQLGHHNIAVSN